MEKIVQDLEVKTDYIAYFVIQGSSSQVYSEVYAYRFSTDDVTPAYITMRAVNPEWSSPPPRMPPCTIPCLPPTSCPPCLGKTWREIIWTQSTEIRLEQR